MEYLIISKDRACQLDLHLRSTHILNSIPTITILYIGSNEEYIQGYNKVKNLYADWDISWIPEIDFRKDFINYLDTLSVPYFLMMGDDNYFIQDFDIQDCISILKNEKVYSVSIRLTDSMDVNAVTQHTMGHPNFIVHNDNQIMWNWTTMNRKYDWGYPAPLTGTVFRKDFIYQEAKRIPYEHPGQLEGKMNHRRDFAKPYLATLNTCCMVDIPMNNVNGVNNKNLNISTEHLNTMFLSGKRISLSTIQNIDTTHSFMSYDFSLQWESCDG